MSAIAPLNFEPIGAISRDSFTVPEFAERVGMSQRSVRRWISLGKLDHWRKGNILRIPASALVTAQGSTL